MSSNRGRRIRRGAAICVTLGAASFAAVGCGERTFGSQELVDELNSAGAGVVLGESLENASDQEAEINSISFSGSSGPSGREEPGAGVLVVLENESVAADEFNRCESAVDFTCFRVANSVLRFTGMTPQEQQRVSEAVVSLESE